VVFRYIYICKCTYIHTCSSRYILKIYTYLNIYTYIHIHNNMNIYIFQGSSMSGDSIPCYPIRGQVLRIKAPLMKNIWFYGTSYVIPNIDTVVIGGTSQKVRLLYLHRSLRHQFWFS
jgi:hypothetical protein